MRSIWQNHALVLDTHSFLPPCGVVLRNHNRTTTSEWKEICSDLCMRDSPQQHTPNQSHAGVIVGDTTGFVGFVCEQPYANPKTVSSIAASNAPPQFGSLRVAYDQHRCSPYNLRSFGCISPGSIIGVVEERADVVGKAVLGTSWHYISHGTNQPRVHEGLLDVPEGRSRAVSTASGYMSENQRVVPTQGDCIYRPLHA